MAAILSHSGGFLITQPDNHRITISLPDIAKAELIINPFSVNILGGENQLLTSIVGICFPNLKGQWQYAHLAHLTSANDTSCQVRLSSFTAPDNINLSVIAEQNSLLLEINAYGNSNLNWLGLDLTSRNDEHFLGLGERFDHLDQRGHEIKLYVQNSTTGGEVYKPIPFYCSTAGYGLQILTDVSCSLHLASDDKPGYVTIRNNAPSMALRILFGNNLKEIISRYTDFCGRLPPPPRWVFGPWKSRSWETDNQQKLLEDLAMEQSLNLPGSVKLIDAAWEPYYHSFSFDPQRFPDPQTMIDRVHQSGNNLILWISPWLSCQKPPTEVYLECVDQGYFIRNPLGQTYVHRITNSPVMFGSCLDFTNPDTIKWWKAHLRRLIRMGIDGFKTDFGEQIPEDAVFFDGRTGHEMHNIYPRLYNQITYEVLEEEEKEGILLARSAWDGSQAYSAIWAGDQTSDFSPATGLKSVILAGQNAGLSGFPYWGSDIGGYFGNPTDEVFIRWAQFGAFSPIMQIHGLGVREPWKFSEQTLQIYRKFAQLHTDLFPYLYTYAKISSQYGIPIMRALVLEFPEDENIWSEICQHEYCFGDQLLVAPVYYGFNRFRYVYLPEGLWRDFWTGSLYIGGKTFKIDADLDIIPVFARGGSIIPLLDPSAHTLLPVEDASIIQVKEDLCIHLYPGADNQFKLYDGTLIRWKETDRQLSIQDSPVPRHISIKFFLPESDIQVKISKRQGDIFSMIDSLNGKLDYTNIAILPGDLYIIEAYN